MPTVLVTTGILNSSVAVPDVAPPVAKVAIDVDAGVPLVPAVAAARFPTSVHDDPFHCSVFAVTLGVYPPNPSAKEPDNPAEPSCCLP